MKAAINTQYKGKLQITDLQRQEIEEKEERRLLIRLHIFYLIL